MNREIKFRVWDKEEKRFWYTDAKGFEWGMFAVYLKYPERYVIQQSTGLLDRNGKEIYEGDILLVGEMEELREDNDAKEYEVKWYGNDGYPSFDLADWGGEANGLSEIASGDVWNCEVIGNIYENPEFLTPKE